MLKDSPRTKAGKIIHTQRREMTWIPSSLQIFLPRLVTMVLRHRTLHEQAGVEDRARASVIELGGGEWLAVQDFRLMRIGRTPR